MNDELRELLADLTQPLPGVAIRRMFGGLGLFADGLMFAIVVGGELYFKADADSAGPFDAENLPPFSYARK
ncbi:TfoX/Sxy family protein, partial [Mycobacterium tuberculosis]|nr:TfoX/Sxy family protein [Mycobacterium tuberculosis]